MSFEFGEKLKIKIYGESHASEIGVYIDGLPKGEKIDFDCLSAFLQKRRGKDSLSTARRESDKPHFISGLDGDTLTGETLKAVIYNEDARPFSYKRTEFMPRPSHADYAAYVKYNGNVNLSGGGKYSGRLTAPLCVAGGIVKQLLEKRGVYIGAHVMSVHGVKDEAFNPINVSKELIKTLNEKTFSVIDENKGKQMEEEILSAKLDGDSVGGIVECAILGLPVGVGEPMFYGIENVISSAVFGVPAIKGIEFGNGFLCAELKGSENNDAFYFDGKEVKTKTNNSGGINGGMANGMPIIFRVAIKPTPTIFKEQETIDLINCENIKVKYQGRHDPCIVPRAVPAIESAVAIAIYNLLMGAGV